MNVFAFEAYVTCNTMLVPVIQHSDSSISIHFRNVHHYMSSHHLSPDADTTQLLTVSPELYMSCRWPIYSASGSLCLLISLLCLFTPLTPSLLVTMCLFSVSMSLFWKKYFLFSGRESSLGNRYYKKKDAKSLGSLLQSLLFLVRKFFTHGLRLWV